MGIENTIRHLMEKVTGKENVQKEDKAAPEGPPIPRRWQGDMVPRENGRGGSVEHSGGGGFYSSGTVRLQWVSREQDDGGRPLRERRPSPCERTQLKLGFRAAGKVYPDLSQLTVHQEKYGHWALDMYGRTVLALWERFPCFDSEDYLHENRYFNWYFLCEDGKLTCVYHTDGTNTVTVTEDVLDVETGCWQQMQKLDCFGERAAQENQA